MPKENDNIGFSAGRLREARKSNGMTLQHLSDATKIAVSTLSKIENNKARLTVEAAIAIAGVLGLPAVALLSPVTALPTENRSLVRRSTGAIYKTPGLIFEILSRDFSKARCLQWRVVVQARSLEDAGGFRAHSGIEFIHVLHGTTTVLFSGNANETLYQGDSLSFDGSLLHAYRSEGFEHSVLLMTNEIETSKERP